MQSRCGCFGGLLLAAIGLTPGCASLAEEPVEEPASVVPLACTSNVTDTTAFFFWELTVDAEPIRAGEFFTVTLGGAVVVPAMNIGTGELLVGGFNEVNVVDARATVHVRSGAIGADRVLRVAEIPHQCLQGLNECNPDNDDLEGIPGLRSNSDCQPEGPSNPCARILPVPTNADCDPGGFCDSRGRADQCELNKFCVSGSVRVPLEPVTAQYFARPDAKEVLFGWDDEGTSATFEGGCWRLPELHRAPFESYEEPTGPNAFRVTARGFPLAMECTMGIASDACGVVASSQGATRAPDSRLIALPVQ